MYRYYRLLWAASTVARYLEDHSTRQEYKSFSEYLKPGDVQAKVLNHWLRQLEKSAEKILGPITPPSSAATPGTPPGAGP
jgi:hypothetical protein